MFKRVFFYIIVSLSFYSVKAQTIVDSLHITPNPFANRTGVCFSCAQNDTVTLKVYNNIGNIMTAIMNVYIDSIMPSGIYNDSIIMDSYPDGIYFVGLHLGMRKTIMKKIIKSTTARLLEITNRVEDIIAYPNPVIDKLKIDLSNNNMACNLEITNALGQVVHLLNDYKSKQEIDLSFLAKGIYYLRIKDNLGVVKIIKK